MTQNVKRRLNSAQKRSLKGAAMVAVAKQLAKRAHRGQFRDDGRTPYITHPAEVARNFAKAPASQAIAWLHDVLEHTAYTSADLRAAGIPLHVIRDVERLSHRQREPYNEYLARVKMRSRTLGIKLVDLRSNLAVSTTKADMIKYARGILFLLS